MRARTRSSRRVLHVLGSCADSLQVGCLHHSRSGSTLREAREVLEIRVIPSHGSIDSQPRSTRKARGGGRGESLPHDNNKTSGNAPPIPIRPRAASLARSSSLYRLFRVFKSESAWPGDSSSESAFRRRPCHAYCTAPTVQPDPPSTPPIPTPTSPRPQRQRVSRLRARQLHAPCTHVGSGRGKGDRGG
jgi:hypothetical protein